MAKHKAIGNEGRFTDIFNTDDVNDNKVTDNSESPVAFTGFSTNCIYLIQFQ